MDVNEYLEGARRFIEDTQREMHGDTPDRLAVNPNDYIELLNWARDNPSLSLSPPQERVIVPGANDFDAIAGISMIVDGNLAHGVVRCDYRTRDMAPVVDMIESVTGFHVSQWQRDWLTRYYEGIGRCTIEPADNTVQWTSRSCIVDWPNRLAGNDNQDGRGWTIADIQRLRRASTPTTGACEEQWNTSVRARHDGHDGVTLEELQAGWNDARLTPDEMAALFAGMPVQPPPFTYDEATRLTPEMAITREEFEARRHELGGELRNPEANVLDEIDRLVDEELTMRQDSYSDPYMAECPRCHGTWHGFERAGCPGETGAKPTVADVPFTHHSDEMRSAPTESVDVTGRGFPPLIRVYDENFREIPADQLGPEWVDIGCIDENGVR